MQDIEIYDRWNIVKKSLQARDKLKFFKERQIWWCNIGQNLGAEVYGKGSDFSRPVLVYKKLSGDLFLGLPLSTRIKNGNWYTTISHNDRPVSVLLSQIRILDKKRLIVRFGHINDLNFNKIKTGFNSLYGSKFSP